MLWGDNKELLKANEKEWRTHIPIEKCLLECAERWDTKLVKGAGLSREKAMLKSGSQKGTKAGDDIWTDVLTEIAVRTKQELDSSISHATRAAGRAWRHERHANRAPN